MPRPSDPNLQDFEARLNSQLKDWRAADPPAALRSQIAARLVPPEKPRRRLIPVLGAGALTGAVALGVLLAYPGSVVRPVPAFAEVQKAMESVDNLSYASEQEQAFKLGAPGVAGKNIRFHQQSQFWIRRNPPAMATVTETNLGGVAHLRTLDLPDRTIEQDLKTGKQISVKKKNRTKTWIDDLLRETTRFDISDPKEGKKWDDRYIVSPWKPVSQVVIGKQATHFRQTITSDPNTQSGRLADVTIVVDVLADSQTRRVVRVEMNTTVRDPKTGITNQETKYTCHDFRYNEPAPPGTFERETPKGK